MRISARNSLAGSVTKVVKGAVNSEVDLTLTGGEKIVAIITNESVTHLGLKEGTRAYAILKASFVILGKGLETTKLSARNILKGNVTKVLDGAVNSEVVMKLSGGSHVTSIITRESCHALALKEGDEVFAVFKASSVILAVD